MDALQSGVLPLSVFSSATEKAPAGTASQPTREELIERHLPLVTFTVKRMSEFIGSGVMEREDAIGYGVKGLISAVDNYDPAKGTMFSTYAVLRIRGAIIDAARAMDMLPRTQRQRIRDLEQVNQELASQLGRWPTVKELALKTGHSIDEVRQIQAHRGMQVISLDQTVTSRDEELELQVEDPDDSVDPAHVADRKAVSKLLSSAMDTLDRRERQILHLIYNEGLPLKDIGRHLSISESRVSQVHRRTIERLRSHLRRWGAA